MNTLTREVIAKALELLAHQFPPEEPRVDLIIVGGAAMVLLFSARDSTRDVDGFQLDVAANEVWREVEQYVVPGREMKARYAFDDLWESEHGTA